MEDRKIRITRSNRKSILLGIDGNGEIYVKAPFHCTNEEICRFLESKQNWLNKHLAESARRMENRKAEQRLTGEEIRALAERAVAYLPGRVRYYADILGVTYGRITVRNQTSRWGSCSSKGNLNFNCLLMLMPPEMIDYTVVHELCHRREMNHSVRFWKLVESVLPDYSERIAWMKENGDSIMARNPRC